MSQISAISTAPEIVRPEETKAGPPPVPRNDNLGGDRRCPACHRPASIAPASSEYRGRGLVHHRWLCGACGHEWITVQHVPA